MIDLAQVAVLLSYERPTETPKQRDLRERAGIAMSKGNAPESLRLLALSYAEPLSFADAILISGLGTDRRTPEGE